MQLGSTLARPYAIELCCVASSSNSIAITVSAWLLINSTGNSVRKAFRETCTTRALWSFRHNRKVESNSARMPSCISAKKSNKRSLRRADYGANLILNFLASHWRRGSIDWWRRCWMNWSAKRLAGRWSEGEQWFGSIWPVDWHIRHASEDRHVHEGREGKWWLKEKRSKRFSARVLISTSYHFLLHSLI